MPDVSLELEIRAPVQRVWAAVVDVESYPASMDSVRSVRICDGHDEPVRRTDWSVILKGSVLQWQEREHLDAQERVMRFEQLTGDLSLFNGAWTLHELAPDLTRASFAVSFEIGIPLLADMLNPIAQRSLHDNCIDMLRGVERQAVDS